MLLTRVGPALAVLLLVAGCRQDERDLCERLVVKAIDAQASLPWSRDASVEACREHPRAVKADPTTRCVLDADSDGEVRVCIAHARDRVKDRMLHAYDEAKQRADEAIRQVDEIDQQIGFLRGDPAPDDALRSELDALEKERGLASTRADTAVERVHKIHIDDACVTNPLKCL